VAEPLKTFFSPGLVKRLAADLGRCDARFDVDGFAQLASTGLDTLELMERAKHIARAMAAHLPRKYPEAIDVLLRSLGPEHATDELIGAGMAPFYYLPHTLFVAEHGLPHFDLSMNAQVELTKRFSAEGSIRHFIAHDPERSWSYLSRWIDDSNAHVRRLVSEGTRLRLPWAMRVAYLDDNPERVIALLDRLKDDPTTLVRRSVANNLNDLGKVHPALLTQTCERWIVDASTERRALVEHALRSAVKRGEPDALRILGFGAQALVEIDDVMIKPKRVPIGDDVSIGFVLRSKSNRAQDLLIDLAVHFVKASGKPSPKVFKVKRITLGPGERVMLSTSVSLAVHTTRKPNPGKHKVDILINGNAIEAGSFDVIAEPTKRRGGA
jgi:3-methyladenine DNA glycosylase AlkC